MPYLRSSIAYDHDFWYTCVEWYLQAFFFFFSFFQILIFWLVGGVNVQKMTKKILPVALHISGTIHQWLSFVVQLCKKIISPGGFFTFSKFWFSGLLGGWKCKKWSKMRANYVFHAPYLRNHKNSSKWQKFCLSCSISQEPYIIWSRFVVLKFKMIISP